MQTAYTYDPVSTPTVAYTLDRAGRRTGVTQGSKTTTLTYNDANQWLTETNTAATLAGVGMVRTETGQFS